MNGTIMRLVRDKGFGFIRDDRGRDVFFHRAVVRDVRVEELREGQTVELEAIDSPRGPRAEVVRRLQR